MNDNNETVKAAISLLWRVYDPAKDDPASPIGLAFRRLYGALEGDSDETALAKLILDSVLDDLVAA